MAGKFRGNRVLVYAHRGKNWPARVRAALRRHDRERIALRQFLLLVLGPRFQAPRQFPNAAWAENQILAANPSGELPHFVLRSTQREPKHAEDSARSA